MDYRCLNKIFQIQQLQFFLLKLVYHRLAFFRLLCTSQIHYFVDPGINNEIFKKRSAIIRQKINLKTEAYQTEYVFLRRERVKGFIGYVSSKSSLESKLILYKATLKPMWTYGIRLYNTATLPSSILRLIKKASQHFQ